MKKLITYPKVQQFRNIVTTINQVSSYVGQDENDEPIYDSTRKKPILTFKGTVKLHGSNASVCFNTTDGFWYQSRQKIITPEKDNAGFAQFAENNQAAFKALMDDVIKQHQIDPTIYTISIYGEWAGKKVQGGVGIAKLEKALYIFGVKISNPNDPDFNSYWVDSIGLKNPESKIYNINDFETYTVEVDFEQPQLAQDKFTEITQNVEKECPVAKEFGIENGMGEGVVWTAEYNGNIYRFKVKGEKHSVVKTKKIVTVDVEKLASINEFVEYAVTENRVKQGFDVVFGKEPLEIKKMGVFIKWIVSDINEEEMDTMKSNNLEPKEVNKYISKKAKDLFIIELNTF